MKSIFLAILFVFSTLSLMAQRTSKSDKQTIQETRKLSNRALKAHNLADFLSYFTNDLSITSGNGSVVLGKDSLEKYLSRVFEEDKDLYFVRTAQRVSVSATGDRAWEEGKWVGLRPDTPGWQNIGGQYAAMWVKEGGVWKIKSELFVTLY
jgi:ketosteroid isomerase-like protein